MNNPKTIIMAYWYGSKIKDLDYETNQEFEYSTEKRNEIIDDITGKGYAVMIRPANYGMSGTHLQIWISDNGKFGQR